MMKPHFETSACRERRENYFAPKLRLPMGTSVPLSPPPPNSNCQRWIALGLILEGSISDFLFLLLPFVFFLAEEPFSFYSDQTSYLSICLEEHNRFQVDHFSQEELKKKVFAYYFQFSFGYLLSLGFLIRGVRVSNPLSLLSFLPSLLAFAPSCALPGEPSPGLIHSLGSRTSPARAALGHAL